MIAGRTTAGSVGGPRLTPAWALAMLAFWIVVLLFVTTRFPVAGAPLAEHATSAGPRAQVETLELTAERTPAAAQLRSGRAPAPSAGRGRDPR